MQILLDALGAIEINFISLIQNLDETHSCGTKIKMNNEISDNCFYVALGLREHAVEYCDDAGVDFYGINIFRIESGYKYRVYIRSMPGHELLDVATVTDEKLIRIGYGNDLFMFLSFEVSYEYNMWFFDWFEIDLDNFTLDEDVED